LLPSSYSFADVLGAFSNELNKIPTPPAISKEELKEMKEKFQKQMFEDTKPILIIPKRRKRKSKVISVTSSKKVIQKVAPNLLSFFENEPPLDIPSGVDLQNIEPFTKSIYEADRQNILAKYEGQWIVFHWRRGVVFASENPIELTGHCTRDTIVLKVGKEDELMKPSRLRSMKYRFGDSLQFEDDCPRAGVYFGIQGEPPQYVCVNDPCRFLCRTLLCAI